MKHVILALGLFMGANAFGQKIKVLNFATFHMVYTPDAHKVAFDADDKKNKSETYEIAKALAAFKPTIICVEMVPGKQDQLDHDYGEFLKREDYRAKIGGEIALIGSANMDRRSFDLNYENNILVEDAGLTATLRARQETYLAQSRQILSEEVASWTIWRRLWNNTLAIVGPVL